MKKKDGLRLFGVFGYPLSHTLSPVMHDAAFQSLAVQAHYIALELRPIFFKKTFSALNKFILDGFNLTVPYKQAVIPYLDRLDPEAKWVGAVNTVYRKGKCWVGTNTDAAGFIRSLRDDARYNPSGKKALVFGAGGAARAVLYGLAFSKASEIMIVNRHPERAAKIAAEFRKFFSKTKFIVMSENKDKEKLRNLFLEADLVVNATSVGLKPGEAPLFPPDAIPRAGKKRILFYDLIYAPKVTSFMKAALNKGHQAVGGIGMLLYQGAAAFEKWTGKKAPVQVMRHALLEALEKRAEK